jgi:hypothetical protein
VQVTSDRLRKGQQKMRALADAIARYASACSHATGRICPQHLLEMDHIDPVVNALDEALVAIRTTDLEVLEASDPFGYPATRRASPKGVVVRALTAPRNNAVHHTEVIDPDLARAIGPLDGGRCIIFPKWKPRSELPSAMFQYSQGKKQGQDRSDYTTSYDSAVAGRLVLDTLMDAFAFLDGCDQRLADRDVEGKLRGFPLAPLPAPGYVRLAPDWPDQETIDHNIRAQVRDEVPAGTSREITGRLSVSAGTVFCGYTNLEHGRRHSFTEDGEQVRRDIEFGYLYFVAVGGRHLEVSVVGDQLQAGGEGLEQLNLADGTVSAEPWSGWWELCASDAGYYRNQRRAI